MPARHFGALALFALGATAAFALIPVAGTSQRPHALSDRNSLNASEASSEAWMQWIESELGGATQVAWNVHTGLPARIYPKEIQLPGGEDLLGWSRTLATALLPGLGIDASELVVVERRTERGLEIIHWEQSIGGVRVDQSHMAIAARNNRVVLIALDLLPRTTGAPIPWRLSETDAGQIAGRHLGAGEAPLAPTAMERLIYPEIGTDGRVHARPTWQVSTLHHDRIRNLRVIVDAADGRILDAYDTNRYATLQGQVRGEIAPKRSDEPLVNLALPYASVQFPGQGTATAGRDGRFSLTVEAEGNYNYTSRLQGEFARTDAWLEIDAKREGSASTETPLDINWDGSKTGNDERNGYYHATQQHDYVKAVDPDYDGTDYQMRVRVGIGRFDNAFWDGRGINFGEGFRLFYNLADFSDVIVHEYTHGSIDKQYGLIQPSTAMHEGISDYWACTVNDDPYLGDGLLRDGPYLRTIDNHKRFPEDLEGEGHVDGEIIGAALWDTRIAVGPKITDALSHYARYLKAKRMELYAMDILVTDDDDGDLSNGTPHGSQIFQAFGHHGLLPAIDMAMLVPTNPEPAAPGQPIEWTLELDNHDPWTQVVDVWVKTHDRIFLVSEDLTILPGKSQVELTGKIPGNAPSGTYTVDTVAGIEGYGRAIPAAAATFQVTIP